MAEPQQTDSTIQDLEGKSTMSLAPTVVPCVSVPPHQGPYADRSKDKPEVNPHCLRPQEGSRVSNQPPPRSPKLERLGIHPGSFIKGRNSEEVLSRHLEELCSEKARTEAHLQSLKKRSANLSVTADTMKQQISEKYEAIRKALHKDEMAMLETIEEDQRVTSAKLNKIMKEWSQHLGQIQRAMANTQKALDQTRGGSILQDNPGECSCPKKKDATEQGIKMNEDRFQRLLKILHNISKDLEAQMHRKVLLLDSSAVTIDSKSSHKNIAVSRDQRSMCYSSEPQPLLDSPLQFDKVCCALGSASLSKGRHYWEVDLSCCSAWSVGIAYGSIERKGNQKNAKLGRNRHSWCIEFRDNQLSAWHNDHYISCGKSQGAVRKVGMLVDCQKGQLAFYNAVTMKLLQEFSGALTAVFDRMHHQFAEPVFPAFRFFKPETGQIKPNHMEICHNDL